jgi:hypothetical protein
MSHRGFFIGLAALAALACGGSTQSPAGDGTGSGPAAGLRCDSSGKNAWDTYGAQAFLAVNDALFANVTAEVAANGTANLGDSFTKVGSGDPPSTADSVDDFKGHLAAFLVYVYGGPSALTLNGKTYAGPQSMPAAHAGLGITSAQYDYFLTSVVVPALTGAGVPSGDVSSCFAPPLVDPAFKASIVGQ